MKKILILSFFIIVFWSSSLFATTSLKDRYKKWSMWAIHESLSPHVDCVNLSSDYNSNTGDLLSTIIAGDPIYIRGEKTAEFSVYTSEYLVKLDQLVAWQTHKKWNTNFYAHYICNVWNEIDLLVWYTDSKSKFLVVRNKEKIDFYDSSKLRLQNGTITWGDVSHCDGSLSKNNKNIIWTCFKGADFSNNKEYYESYTIPLYGWKILKRKFAKNI